MEMEIPNVDVILENSTDISETTPSGEFFYGHNDVQTIEYLALTIYIYYTPLLIVVGCIGNLISITVFLKSKLRMQSMSQYLSALALSDVLYLCQLVPPWLKMVQVSSMFARSGFCQLSVYLSYVTCNYSSWLVVAFTVERFVAVVYPLRLNAFYTVKRTRYIVVSLAAVALLVNVPVLWFTAVTGEDCTIAEPLMAHAARFNNFDTVVTFTLPLAAIVLLNSCVVWGVYNTRRAQPYHIRQQQPDSQQRVTRMLLIVSSVFVLLNLPAYTMRIIAYGISMDQTEPTSKFAALQYFFSSLFNTNFGINFILYCMTGHNFRCALQETFAWLRRRDREPSFYGC